MRTAERIISIDAVRGFAVLGIFLMNVVSMGLDGAAYDDPSSGGGDTGADLGTWFVSFVLVDGKMRALFTMLFGASTVLMAERNASSLGSTLNPGTHLSPGQTHYRRMAWLFVFGMLHAHLLWTGDILCIYAIAGCIVYPLRRLPDKCLIALGAAGLAVLMLGWDDIWAVEMPYPDFFLSVTFGDTLEAVAQMCIGMGLYRLGFFSLGWTKQAYRSVIAVGYLIAAPLSAYLAWRFYDSAWQYDVLDSNLRLTVGLRPFVALAHASALLLLVASGGAAWLVARLAAAGRMALSNYLGASIIGSIVFSARGLGLYGELSRFELLALVAIVWVFILAWSEPWLQRYRYGPFEWLWRSLVRLKPQPLRVRAAEAVAR
jgi:uncharacterized protein